MGYRFRLLFLMRGICVFLQSLRKRGSSARLHVDGLLAFLLCRAGMHSPWGCAASTCPLPSCGQTPAPACWALTDTPACHCRTQLPPLPALRPSSVLSLFWHLGFLLPSFTFTNASKFVSVPFYLQYLCIRLGAGSVLFLQCVLEMDISRLSSLLIVLYLRHLLTMK